MRDSDLSWMEKVILSKAHKIDDLKKALQEVLDNEKDPKNCTKLSIWTRARITNALR